MDMTATMRPHTAIDAAMNAGSWSEMVKGIETSKKTLPWAKNDFVPTRRIPLPERKQIERALNPVTMTFRDEARERAHTAAKMERTQTAVLDRVKKINEKHYNIISHTGPPRKIDSMRETLKEIEPKPPRKWNMFSHLPHDKQTTCPILFDENYMRTYVKPERTQIPPEQVKREFNIINNEFAENHDERLKEEYSNLKKDMVERYWAKHSFDPVIGEFYSDEKEAEFRANQKQISSTWGTAQLARLPKSYAESEGKAYDILTLDTKDEHKLSKALSKDIKKNNRLNKFKGMTKKQVEAGKKEYDRLEDMRLNRVNYKRFEEEIDRGYDFVFTTKGSIASKNLEHVRPRPTGSGWNHVEAGRSMTGSQSMPNLPPKTAPAPASTFTVSPRSNAVLNSTGPIASARGQTAGSSSGSARASTSARAMGVPSLDLTRANQVRTGGLSSYD